jgi:hypothetical protein
MNSNLNLIACVLDRSGSMGAIRTDAIFGFNTFLAEQKKLPGQAQLTLVLFDNEYDVIHNAVEINSVPDLTVATYIPRGSTALLDAVGRTIDNIGAQLDATPEQDRPAQVIIAILTDGLENASHEYTRGRVAQMVKHQQERYGWQFVFLGANMDAFAEGKALNIPTANIANFAATREGTQTAYRGMSETVASYRVGN